MHFKSEDESEISDRSRQPLAQFLHQSEISDTHIGLNLTLMHFKSEVESEISDQPMITCA